MYVIYDTRVQCKVEIGRSVDKRRLRFISEPLRVQ